MDDKANQKKLATNKHEKTRKGISKESDGGFQVGQIILYLMKWMIN